MHYNIRKSYVVADAAGVPGGGPRSRAEGLGAGGGPQARQVCRAEGRRPGRCAGRRAAGPAAEPPKRAEPACPPQSGGRPAARTPDFAEIPAA